MKATLVILALMVSIGVLLFARAWNAPVVFKAVGTGEVCGCVTSEDTYPSLDACEGIDLNNDLYEVVWTQVCL